MKKSTFFAVLFATLFFGATSAHAATLSITSETGSITAGTEFALNIKLDSEGASVNAVQATLKYPKDVLEVVRTDKTGSAFTFWLEEPSISAENGTVRFTTGATSGLSGKSLQVLRVVFRMKGNGVADISLTDSAVTAADGAGTNVLSHSNGLKITAAVPSGTSEEIPLAIPIIPKPVQITRAPVQASVAARAPQVTVPFYPEQAAWHNLSSPFLAQWELPADVSGVAAVINHDPLFAPTTSEGLFDDKMFPALENGIQYLHVRFKNNIGWGTTAHYRLAIDAAPPVGFEVVVVEGNPSAVANPSLSYASADQLSGILDYTIRINNNEKIRTTDSSYKLDLLAPGKYTVRVAAEDKAGNSSETTLALEILPIPSPVIAYVNPGAYVGEGNLYANGSAPVGTTLLVSLKDAQEQVTYSDTVIPDAEGKWALNIGKPLTKGMYYLEVTAKDSRGALSYPVRSAPIKVAPKPLLTILNIEITQFWFYTVTSLLMLGALVLGTWMERRRKQFRGSNIFVIQKDVSNLVASVQKDVTFLGDRMSTYELSESAANESNIILDKMQGTLKKIADYVFKHIDEVGK